jgi:predicted CopG family antitoxin
MAGKMHRAQVMIEPEQHRALVEMARREGRSVSDLLREMLRQQIAQRAQLADAAMKRRLEALDRLQRRGEAALAERDGQPAAFDVVEAIQKMRKERDERNLGFRLDSGD